MTNPNRELRNRLETLISDTKDTKSGKVTPQPPPPQRPERIPPMRLTIKDGFYFGCGFFMANLFAGLIIGLIILMIITLLTVSTTNIPQLVKPF